MPDINVFLQPIFDLGFGGVFLLGTGVIFASVLRAFSGFGMALAIIPIAAMIIGAEQAIVLSAMMTIFASLSGVMKTHSHVDRRPLSWLFLGALAGTPVGLALLAAMSAEVLRTSIGAVVVLSSFVLWKVQPRVRVLPVPVTGFAGFFSGVLSGALALPGPPVIVYFLARGDDPAVTRASLIAFFLFTNSLALLGFFLAGLVDAKSLAYLMLALPFLILGNQIGFHLFERYGSDWYRKVAILAFLGVGTVSLINALW